MGNIRPRASTALRSSHRSKSGVRTWTRMRSIGLVVLFSSLTGLAGVLSGCASTGGSAAAGSSADAFRVMSFNIRYDTPNDGENAWPHRKDMAASVIRFHDADFAGLQEALLGQIEDLAARLPGYQWIGVGRTDGKSEGEFTPIFYRADRFEEVEHDTFWLSETPAVPGSKSWDTAITRIATWGIFRDRRSGERFVVLNTHFDHIGTEARAESARLIVERLAAFDLPTIVTGDFNTTPDSEPYRILTAEGSRLKDAFDVTQFPHHGPTTTWNGFEAIAPDRRIDFVFVDDEVRVIRHGILSETVDGRFPSDHLPVIAEVRLDR